MLGQVMNTFTHVSFMSNGYIHVTQICKSNLHCYNPLLFIAKWNNLQSEIYVTKILQIYIFLHWILMGYNKLSTKYNVGIVIIK
jgi:hypothetical protein